MNLPATALHAALLCAVLGTSYYATTLAIWFGHRLPHRARGRLRAFHMDGHHRLYPDAAHARSRVFLYGHGAHDSLVPLAPWVLALVALHWLVYPASAALIGTLAVGAIVAAASYLHSRFHLERCWLSRFEWFRRARATHDLHHDSDVNFMVVDHFWDRRFGTYQAPDPLGAWASRRGRSEAAP